jgi:hypothetical protein
MNWKTLRSPLRSMITKFFVFCFLTSFCVCLARAQPEQTQSLLQRRNESVLSCDDGVARQDFIVSEALEKLKDDTFLFVILRQSINESSENLAERRLFNIQRYFFKERGSRLPGKKVVIAIGQPVEGLGRVEYYIDGRLFEFLFYPRNGFICHSCCGPDDSYYPDKGRKKKAAKPTRDRIHR